MKKRNILISGGNGRIGSALAKALLDSGNNVLIGDLNKSAKLNKFLSNKKNLYFYKTDLTKEKNLKNFIKYGEKNFKSIDVFIHCLYPHTKDWGKKIENLKQDSLNKNISDNLGTSIILSKLLIKKFLKQKKGNLIFFSSIYGTEVPKFEDYPKGKIYSTIEYAAVKSGIISITKYLAKLYKKKNLRINCISPGGIKDNQSIFFQNRYSNHCNSKGLLQSEDLVGLVEFLISDNSKFINGQNIIIDDGWSL
jgi:NAD(P)-dependent dehydrogenase (short-subunit alcohol dehydrogenase family)